VVLPIEISPGDIFLIADELVEFPEDELKIYEREHKGLRPIIILQCKEDCKSAYPRSILMAPLSSKIEVKFPYDFLVNKGEGGLHYDSVVRLGAIQPILKIHLKARSGAIEPDTYKRLKQTLAANFGMISRVK